MINLNYGDSDMLMKTQIINKKKDETFILQPEDFNQVKEHPRNVDLYDPKVDYAEDNQDYQGLKEDIKNEFNKNKKHGNLEPITISKNGFILSGHRRFNAGKDMGVPLKFVVSDEIVDLSKPVSEQYQQLMNFNISKQLQRKEDTYEAIHYKAKSVYTAALEDGLGEKESKKREKHIYMTYNVDPSNSNKIKTIMKMGRIDLLRKVDLKDISIHKAYEKAKEVSNTEVNPNQFNWVNVFKNNKELVNEVVSETKRIIKHELSWKTKNGHNILDPNQGQEKSGVSTAISHKVMQVISCAINRHTDIEALTAVASGAGTPDVFFPGLTKIARDKNPNFQKEALEIKGSTWASTSTDWYGGPGFRMDIHRDYYILFTFEANYTRFMMMCVQVNKDDVKVHDNRKSKCSFQDLMRNHYDKDDYFMLAGEVYKTNNKFSIDNWEKIN